MRKAGAEDFGHLGIALATAVPLHIWELEAAGGPSADDLASLPDISRLLAEQGDNLLFKSKKPGETARLFNETARALAILAFSPGGVTAFGQHWEGRRKETEEEAMVAQAADISDWEEGEQLKDLLARRQDLAAALAAIEADKADLDAELLLLVRVRLMAHPGQEAVDVGEFRLRPAQSVGRPQIKAELLLSQGVAPEVIAQATVPGKPGKLWLRVSKIGEREHGDHAEDD